jgi:beta-lactamase superfamily II metal-dependent hydrolase
MKKIKFRPKPILVMLLLALSMVILAACFGEATRPQVPSPDFDIQTKGGSEVLEPNPNDLLTAHFINVGEGDAILIVQGDYAMLIDGGPVEMGTTVFSYLRDQGISTLDYLVATYPFADHAGGLPDVLRRISVRNVLLPIVYHDTSAYNNFLLAVENSGANVETPFAGQTFALGEANITILSPSHADQWENRANYSIVMRVEFGSTGFPLMGDAMREVEANLLDSATRLSSDVLKVARHGASSATTSGFLDAVGPSHNRGQGNFFADIWTLQYGDKILYETTLGTRVYEVVSIDLIFQTDFSSLAHTHENMLTLVTYVHGQSNIRWSVSAREAI